MHEHLKIKKIVSIDFEESVINKMKERGVPIEYKVMDMLNMSGIENNSFDYVVDKGTLDALCIDAAEETKTKVIQYLSEIQRVLANKEGVYVCVSLLQDFVLESLINYFSRGIGNKYHKEYINHINI